MSAVRQWVGGFIIVAGTVTIAPRVMAQQEGTTPDSVPLAARVDELEQQILVLKRLRELEADSIAAAAKDKASVDGERRRTASASSRPTASTSSSSAATPRPTAASTAGDEAKAVPNTFFLRRARPIVEATVGKYFGFRIMPDFAQGQTVLFDAYGDVNLTPAFAVRLGKFKPPVGLERLQSATDIVFAERGLPTNLVPNRDIGLQLGGDIHSGVLNYAVGVFNGVVDLGNGDGDLNDSKDLDARVFLQPITQGSLKGLGIGIAATTGTEQGGLSGTTLSSGLPSYRSPGQQTVFRYRVDAAAPLNSVIADGSGADWCRRATSTADRSACRASTPSPVRRSGSAPPPQSSPTKRGRRAARSS